VSTPTTTPTPLGFRSHVANAGVKDDSLDFSVIASDAPCTAAGLFTQSRFAGASVLLSRRHVADGRARAIVTVSKNANVATGEQGDADSTTLAAGVAAALGIDAEEVLVSSTGVIGRLLPMDRIGAHLDRLRADPDAFELGGLDQVAVAMMTTDTVPKTASAAVGEATIVGLAKGVGMIEPDMATLLTYFVTDAAVGTDDLRAIFGRVVATTFNCLSIDTDTSTSDTALVLANGLAGAVDLGAFESALHAVALDLVKQIARDGEGATKLIEVTVEGAADAVQAKRVAKLVVNSPLVKTAVHGCDPNWGRVAMAIGKASEYTDIDPARTAIRFGAIEVFPRPLDESDLAALQSVMDADEVTIGVSLGLADASATVWGCDLSDGYVRINADYTT
jgi:glutamate N-acetyltransferase/amino-acid N-acetyltransferase